MKIGNIDGTPEEIHNLCINNGIRIEDFLEPSKKLALIWVIIPSSLFVAFSFTLKCANQFAQPLIWLLIIIELLFAVWLTASIHLRFKNKTVTLICGFIFIVIMGYCANILKLDEAFRLIQNKIEIKSP